MSHPYMPPPSERCDPARVAALAVALPLDPLTEITVKGLTSLPPLYGLALALEADRTDEYLDELGALGPPGLEVAATLAEVVDTWHAACAELSPEALDAETEAASLLASATVSLLTMGFPAEADDDLLDLVSGLLVHGSAEVDWRTVLLVLSSSSTEHLSAIAAGRSN